MPNFSYVCVDDNGLELEGVLTAENEDQLADLLRRQGQYLVRTTPASTRTGLADIRILERINRRDIIFFTQQLSTVMATGVGRVEGLGDVESQLKKQGMKRVVGGLRRDIEAGESLSTAMAKHPKAFSDLYVNVVKAGEATGTIERALDDLVAQLEWQADLSARIREVSTYPLLVVVMLGVLSVVLVGFTIPRVMAVYERLNAQIELPLPTRMVMAASAIARTYWSLFLTALMTVVVSLRMYGQTPHGAVRLSRIAMRTPVIGELLRKIALSRFAHYFASLHDSGLEVAPSLAL